MSGRCDSKTREDRTMGSRDQQKTRWPDCVEGVSGTVERLRGVCLIDVVHVVD